MPGSDLASGERDVNKRDKAVPHGGGDPGTGHLWAQAEKEKAPLDTACPRFPV